MAINPNSKGLWEKMIQLTSGGFIRIEVVGHPLDMAEDDRAFVEDVVDRIKEYEDDARKYGPKAPAHTQEKCVDKACRECWPAEAS